MSSRTKALGLAALVTVVTVPRGPLGPGKADGTAHAQGATTGGTGNSTGEPGRVTVDPRDDRVQRKAIRGGPLDLSRESEELRALRSFEEESFPKHLGPPGRAPTGPQQSELTSGLGPDAAEVHSPLAKNPADDATPAPTGVPWLAALKLLDNLGLGPTFVRFEAHVIKYLEFYREEKRGRSIMASWLKKQGRYRTLIEQVLDKHGLPRFLLYIAMIESGYDPHDRSHKGAVGLWQFMPEGARIYGLRVDYWVDERKDPIRSTEAAARYLGDLKARFGSWHLSLAAFNAGYGAVLRAIQKYNTNDYWELCRHEDGLPWETLHYVPKAIATALVGENRSFFGYEDVPADPGLQYDTVAVTSSVSVQQVAHAVSSTPEEIQRLNPELRRGRTPPLGAGESWALRLPPGTASQFLANIESERKGERLVPYVVRFGERLEDIAHERGTSPYTLRRLNGVEETAEIRAGLTLLIPQSSRDRARDADPEKSRDKSSAEVASSDEVIVVPVPDKALVVPGKKRVFYRVIPGDTIWAISRFFKVRDADLLRWNNLDPEATLAVKMVLDVWVDKDFDESQALLVDPARVRVVTTGSEEFFDLVETLRGRKRFRYTAKAGDTWEKVAKKFGFTIADLERINRTGRATELVPGQALVVYQTMSAGERSTAIRKLLGRPDPESEAASDDTKTSKATSRGARSDASSEKNKAGPLRVSKTVGAPISDDSDETPPAPDTKPEGEAAEPNPVKLPPPPPVDEP